jgi:hypothetical protein
MTTNPFDRLPKTLATVRTFNAGKGILIVLIGAILYIGHSAFIPVALALLAALILSSPVEMLFRLGLPSGRIGRTRMDPQPAMVCVGASYSGNDSEKSDPSRSADDPS